MNFAPSTHPHRISATKTVPRDSLSPETIPGHLAAATQRLEAYAETQQMALDWETVQAVVEPGIKGSPVAIIRASASVL